MNIDEFERALLTMNPPAKIYKDQSGVTTWMNICVAEKTFSVEFVPGQGIGVSELDFSQPSDFAGHDEEYQEFESVLEFIKLKLAQ